ncbi:MAG: FecR domain-containing protein [Spirochaetaceae bacterium]
MHIGSKSVSSLHRIALLLIFLVLSVVTAAASPPGGEIVYMEGEVDILRDGTRVPSHRVDAGFIIEEFDMVETGSGGYVEFVLTSSYGGGASVTVNPNTSFYFEGVEGKKRKETEFSTMAGSMAYKVKKLSGNEAFRVRTESAVMGVRGTDFDVTISPEGSVLVACEEGRVAVTDEKEGASYYSEPGQVVEKLTEQGVQSRRVSASELESFRESWIESREEVFKRGAPTFIKSYGRRYLQYLPKFEEVYKELETHRSKLKRFEGEGVPGSLGDVFRTKSDASPAVVKMRSILPVFEHVFFRLQTLERYHSQGIGKGMIDSKTSSERFFRSFRNESSKVKEMLSETYYLLRLYQKAHEASGGGPSILDDPFGGEDGFGGGSMPKPMFDR